MYAATIYKNGFEVAKVYAANAFAAENKAIDYIEDAEDEGNNITGYDYDVNQEKEADPLPEMPADIAYLYTPQSCGSLYEPPIAAPIWEDIEDEEPPVEEDMDPEDLPSWDTSLEGLDPNPYFYFC